MMCPYFMSAKWNEQMKWCINQWCTLMDEDAMCLTGNTDNCPYGEGGKDEWPTLV